jgi:hypothetical protein
MQNPEVGLTRREFLHLAGVYITGVLFSSCTSEEKPAPVPIRVAPLQATPMVKATALPTQTPFKTEVTPTVIQKTRTNYLWGLEQTEYFRLSKETRLSSYQTTVFKKPPFYEGDEPLVFKSFQLLQPTGGFGGFGGLGKTVVHDFGDFLNLFVYKNYTLVGAVTLSKSQNIVMAEAKIEPTAESKRFPEAVYISEVHYDKKGNVTFTAKSEINAAGQKVMEIEKQGRKSGEYYFMWPSLW